MNLDAPINTFKHVAIIMDGNGRWATSRSRPRIWGHIRGAHIVSEIVEAADDLGLNALTLYAFSTENWSRPVPEIRVLFILLKKFIKKERKRILENNIRFKVIGETTGLPQGTQKLINDLENETENNKGLKLTFAFSYGGRSEVVTAVNKFIVENPGKEMTDSDLESNLLLSDIGDVDLLIRTGGDQRISNFLLWQSAYAELFFTKTRWPDFTTKEFKTIVHTVSARERRFGGVDANNCLTDTTLQALENKTLITEQVIQ